MQQRRLGPGQLPVSAIGFGCMGLSQGYGLADDEQSVATIHTALDHGITLIDTAMSYGSGHNEELVGRALAGRRDQAVLATKFGIVRGPNGPRLDGRPENVPTHCEASLKRLGVESIDLYYLHRVDPEVPLADTVGAMAELVTAGKVKHLGISEANPDQLRQAVAVHPITAVQFEWSLLWREPEDDVVPVARSLGVGLVPYSPLGRGMLTETRPPSSFAPGDFRGADPRFGAEHREQNLAQVDALRTIAEEKGISVGQLALAWLIAQGPDVVPIPGTRRAARVVDNAGAGDLTLDASDLRRIEDLVPRSGWGGDRTSFAAHGVVRNGS